MLDHAALTRLAHAHGVSTEYWDWHGTHRTVSDATVCQVLRALGVACDDDEQVAASLADLDDAPWRDVVPPTTVVREHATPRFGVHVPHGEPVQVWVDLESDPALGTTGGRIECAQVDHWVDPRIVDGVLTGRATFELPAGLPLGWHTLRAQTPSILAAGVLVVAPETLSLPQYLRRGRSWGLMAQLYSVRSPRSWGVGDFQDLGDLGYLAGRDLGADFVLVNPLHAAEPSAPLTPSPYLPTTRSFLNPLYIRPESIPEYAYASGAVRAEVASLAAATAPLNSGSAMLDRDASWTAKRQALEAIFALMRPPARERAFAQFRERGGTTLQRFAVWSALEDYFGPQGWPHEVDHADDAAVAALAAQPGLDRRVEFFAWLQWIADEQLAAAHRSAKAGGMRLGLCQDLAVGVHPFGADVWAMSQLLATSMTVGAPPDNFNQQGQDWSQPPWRPDALVRTGYGAYRAMLRSILAHAGALRIDHILGLFRLWWIPQGSTPDQGTYVRFDHDAMVSILVLEAHRAGAVVIGEDLGVVEPWVRTYLAERGVLGTSVMWFEKLDGSLTPRPPEQYRRLALATVTTHDLPPTAGYLRGTHVELRGELGLLDEPIEQARAAAAAEREAFVRMLRDRGLVGAEPSLDDVALALHRALLATPSVLIGVSLADAVGERRTQNQPGTDRQYPNWCVPLGDADGRPVSLDELVDLPQVRALAAAMSPVT